MTSQHQRLPLFSAGSASIQARCTFKREKGSLSLDLAEDMTGNMRGPALTLVYVPSKSSSQCSAEAQMNNLSRLDDFNGFTRAVQA
jgi:hypothetical protein